MRIAASIIGYVATACLVFSFQCKKEKLLFLFQTVSAFLFILHYGLNGDYTGMAMDGIAFVRAFLMASGKKPLTGKAALGVLLTAILVLGVLTWQDWFSVFPVIALLVSTVFLYSGDGKKIRRAQFFCTSPTWMVYNVRVASIPGIICEALDMASVLVYWIRNRKTEAHE